MTALKILGLIYEVGIGGFALYCIADAERLLHRKFKIATTNIPEEIITLSDSNWSYL